MIWSSRAAAATVHVNLMRRLTVPHRIAFRRVTEVDRVGNSVALQGLQHCRPFYFWGSGNLAALYAIFDDKRHPYYEHRLAA